MMFTTKENCTVTVKDYLYIYIKNKTKYSRQMHQIYHVSWFTYLYSTQSFSSKLQWCSRLAFSLGYMSLDNRPRVALEFRSVVILRIQPIITITTVSYSVLKGDIEVQSTVCDGENGTHSLSFSRRKHGNDSIERDFFWNQGLKYYVHSLFYLNLFSLLF